ISILEGAVSRVSGIYNISSSSEENEGRMRIEFQPNVDLDSAASDVRVSVSRVLRRLFDRLEQVMVVTVEYDCYPTLTILRLSDSVYRAGHHSRADLDRRRRRRPALRCPRAHAPGGGRPAQADELRAVDHGRLERADAGAFRRAGRQLPLGRPGADRAGRCLG